MANRHVSHIKSNQTVTSSENGVTTVSPKLPTTQQILYGEIAINYAKGYEKLAIKNSNDEIVTFPTDQQFERVEEVISEALNDLDGRVVELNTEITSIEAQKIDNVLWDTDSTTGQVTLRLRHNNGDSTYTDVASVQIPFADNGNAGVIDGTGSGLTLDSGVIGLDIQTPLYITPDEELSVQKASTSNWGVVKIGSGISVSNGVISVASASNLSLGQGYAICNTQASTTAKVVSLTGYELEDGGIVSIKFTYDVPASATLNINNKGAGTIYYRGSAITDGVIKAGDIATLMYNSGNYYLISIDRWDESKIDSISVNGTAQAITNKNVDFTIGEATLSIQKNGTTIDTFSANATTDKTVNITVPVSSDYLGSFDLSIDSSTYVMTLQGKDGAGNNKGTAQTIDLPLETMVVNGSYDSTNQKIVLTLKNGTTVDIPIGALINGLQEEITSTNKLSADLVEDGNTNKVYTATEKTKLSGIAEGAEVNVQSNWNESDTTSDAYIQNKPTVGNATITIQKNGTNVDSFALNSTTAKTINIANVQDTLSASNKLNADYIQDGTSNKVFTAEDKEKLDGIDDRFDALIANDEKIEKVTASALNDLDSRINNIATNTVDGISYENVSASGGKVSITHTDSGATTTVDEALIPIVSTGTNAVNGLMTPAMLENIDTISDTLEDLESVVEEGQKVTANSLVELDGRITSTESTITALEQTVDDNELVTATALNVLNDNISDINSSVSDINSSVSGLSNSVSGLSNSISLMSDAIDDIEEEMDNLSLMEEVTYSQLVALKNGGNLVPGMKYRITDYTTAINSDYSSTVSFAGHNFDIVVTALSNNELSENASAVHHSGDTYFANSNLSAWQLKYTTDNTFNIFSTISQLVTGSLWDTENSKGIIYYMKDEWCNECIYDFKNLMFTSEDKTLYTFNYAVTEGGTTTYSDCTVGSTTKASFNIIKGIMVFFINTENGTSKFNIVENTFIANFGSNCNNNKIYNATMSEFGDGCYNLDLNNAWGFICGNMCTDITGSPDDCSLGNNCSDIKFGTNTNIHFGDDCHNISIASGNNNIKTVDPNDPDVIIGRFSDIDIKENNSHILLTTTETLGDSDYIQNLTLDRGLNTNSSEAITISHNSKNDNFNTTYQKASSKTVYIA